ncbi:MAG: glycosyltransferase [Paracoccaceae bacterium]
MSEALSQLADGNAKLAREMFLQAEREGESSARMFVGLGTAAMALHDPGQAEYWWLQASFKEPSNIECHLGLAAARHHLGKLAQAIDSYRQALDTDPTHQGACASLAIAYLEAGCPAQALAHSNQALSYDPAYVDMRLTRASALIELGCAEEAIGDLAWLYVRGAKLGEVGLLECRVNCALGDFEVALMLAAELAEAYPTLSAPLTTFRTVFEDFLKSAAPTRVNDFLAGLGLPTHATRLASVDGPKRRRRKPHTTDVIIPVHDGLDHLQACLESIERHRSPSLGQIILVNDCSSAETRAWLRKYARARPNVHLLHTRKRSGFTRSLALGLTSSLAKRFVALNSDCVVGEHWLERLSAAMPPQSRVAMVGPLSNTAAWQTLGDVFDATGNYAVHPMPSVAEIGRVQKRLDLLKVFDAPATALVHGFCVLVDRKKFDDLGGLDDGLFPEGYGEFQDFSLRALDAGLELRIADDCFVGHAQGGSISSTRRATLSIEARRKLYQRYTALRYLSAECSAVLRPQVAVTRQRFDTLDRYCPGDVTTCETPAKVSIHGDTNVRLAGQRVCVFVSFAPDGRLLPYTQLYLSELKAQGFQTVLVLNEVGRHRLPPEALGLARVVMLRDNLGYDFGAWRDAVARLPAVWDAETLIFANDSLVGPFQGFDRLLARIAESTVPLFFMTESDFAIRHFQSFFWGVKGSGLTNPILRAFLASVRDVTDKTAAVFLYEVFFRHVCESLAGMRSLCLFPLAELTGVDSDIRPTFNPTHHLWRELLRSGFPFLKVDFCRKNSTGADAVSWQEEIVAHGGDRRLAQLHIEAVQVQRMKR